MAVVAVWRGRDVALVYAGIVVSMAAGLTWAPRVVAEQVIFSSSTNLVDLRLHPPLVLVASAFVEPSVWSLWIVVPLVWALGELQRWLGRAVVLVMAVLGHVTATLMVATMLTAGIARDRDPLTAATATDVGVSYGLVAVLGLLSARPGWRRLRTYSAISGTGLLAMLLVSRSFTDLGHLVAWLVGLTVALVVRKALAGAALPPKV